MLVSIVIYFFVAEHSGPPPHQLEPAFVSAITILALCLAASLFLVRHLTVGKSERALSARPDDAAALKRWRTGYIITFAICEAIVLYGVVLRFAGLEPRRTFPFYIAGFVLMLVSAPRRPLI
jgi:ABC-type Fe3+ transport system permease subunit